MTAVLDLTAEFTWRPALLECEISKPPDSRFNGATQDQLEEFGPTRSVTGPCSRAGELLPEQSAAKRRCRQRHVPVGTFYPSGARHLSVAWLPPYAGEVGTADARPDMKAEAQSRDGRDCRAAGGLQFLQGRPAVHRRQAPSIADIRRCRRSSSCAAIDYEFPAWAEEYIDRGWRGRSATRTRSRRPTCAATSPR